MNNKLAIVFLVLFLLPIVSFWISPLLAPVFGMFSLLLSLALSTYNIYTKHARVKILKEVGLLVLTLVIILFLGGIATTLANYQASIRWGEVAGLVSALGASFAVGYLVRVGMVKLSGLQSRHAEA